MEQGSAISQKVRPYDWQRSESEGSDPPASHGQSDRAAARRTLSVPHSAGGPGTPPGSRTSVNDDAADDAGMHLACTSQRLHLLSVDSGVAVQEDPGSARPSARSDGGGLVKTHSLPSGRRPPSPHVLKACSTTASRTRLRSVSFSHQPGAGLAAAGAAASGDGGGGEGRLLEQRPPTPFAAIHGTPQPPPCAD